MSDPLTPRDKLSRITNDTLLGITYTAPNLEPSENPDSLITLKDSTDLDWETVAGDGTTTKALEIIDLDAATADVTRTLPPVASAAGQRFKYVVENVSSSYYCVVKAAAGETILGYVDGSRVLSLNGDHIEFFSTGVNWIILIDERLGISSLSRIDNQITLPITNAPVKFASFDSLDFTTPGRLEGDVTTSDIATAENGAASHGYRVNFSSLMSASTNDVVRANLYKNGVITALSGGIDLAGSGGGTRGGHVSFSGYIEGAAGDVFEIWVQNSGGGNTDFNDVIFSMECLTK